jgi:TRAP-type C4-dicarboxylate transport system permease small subunit
MLLVASTFIGSAYVLSEKGHVNMEYLYSFMSEKSITKLKIFTDTLCLIFFSILFYVSLEITAEAFIKNHNTGTIWGPPLWIPYSSMLIGATLMVMSYIAELIKLTRKLKEL